MKFNALPSLAHDTVSLRPIVEADLPVWFAYLSQPSVVEHTSWNLSGSADLAPYLWAPENITDSSLLRLAISLRSTGALVGTMGFHTVSPQNRSAEIAFDLAPEIRGQGIATAVCRQFVDWAHADAGLLRVQATALESNLRSVAVLERCGFVREGLLRSFRLVRGVPRNFWMYSHVPGFSAAA